MPIKQLKAKTESNNRIKKQNMEERQRNEFGIY